MIHDASVLPMSRTLAALSAILTKAEGQCAARKIDPAVVLGLRLTPDMLNFTRQVQTACDFAARAAARLSQTEIPSFPDTETTFDDLRARIATARAFIEGLPATAFDGADARSITMTLRGSDMTMTGLEYLTFFALPNFYFHATTAYAILRANGFDLGKGDFMGA